MPNVMRLKNEEVKNVSFCFLVLIFSQIFLSHHAPATFIVCVSVCVNAVHRGSRRVACARTLYRHQWVLSSHPRERQNHVPHSVGPGTRVFAID